MASLLQRKKVKQLFEQSMAAGGLPAFRENWDRSLGIYGQQFEQDHREVAHQDFHVGEICHTLLGNDWRDSIDQGWREAGARRFESAILPGELSYVSGALDVIAGLMNARALERAANPEWIWDRMCTVEEATGEGGFHIGLRNMPDSQPSKDLADGQSLPEAKIIGTRIHRNRTLNQGLRVKVNYWTLRDDLTGQIMDAVDNTAVQVLAERERKICDAVLGIAPSGSGATFALNVSSGTTIGIDGLAIPCIQDGLTFFPYQKGVYGTNVNAVVVSPENGLAVANFANCQDTDTFGLADYMAIQRAIATMVQNLDPFTGLPTQLDFRGMQFFVAPAAEVQLKFLLQAEQIWQLGAIALTTAYGTNNVSKFNLVRDLGLEIVTSQFWATRCCTAGLTTVGPTGTYAHQALTQAVADTYHTAGSIMSAFWMGHFKKAVHYWQRMPYQVVQVPLSSMEYGEQTVLVQDQRERGQAFWVDPRQVYRTWA
jgi:hypothetical protein